ncbi:UNVERIFIED_CONTAM: hypothetical protein FKN15_023231 [Acipenser sinensis]
MNTRCPQKRVPSAARFFTLSRLTVQPPQSYSVGGQRSSGQLTGKPAGALPDYRGRWCAVSRGHPGRPTPPPPRTTLSQLSATPWELPSTECDLSLEDLSETLMQIKTFRLQRANEQLDSLQKEEGSGKGEDLSRSFRELQASHAETILELEKTRDMLILQHKINKDYQTELQAVMRNVEADKEESKRKEEQSTRLLELRANRIHTVEGSRGQSCGILEYWLRLGIPVERTVRLHQDRMTALGYLSSHRDRLQESRSLSSQHALGGGSGGISCELEVCVESCSGLSAHWPGLLPDAYVVYKLYDLPDHDSPIIPCSADPVFRDQATFHLPMTFDLQRYLRFESLWIYIFDDADSEQTAYLGKASVPLISLSLGKDIRGDFILRDPAGRPSGSIKVCLSWKSPYQPPGTALRQAAETIEQLLEREREPSVGAPPRHTPVAKPRARPPPARTVPPQHPPAHRRKKLRLAMPPSPPDTVRGEQEEERVREERGGRGQWINDREEEERGVAEDAMEEEEAGQEVESEYSGRSEEAHVSEEVESEQARTVPPQHPPSHRRKKLRLAMPPSPPDTVRGEQEEERVREERGGRGQWINDREEEERGVAEDAMEEEEAGQEVESEYSGRSEEAHVSEEVESEQARTVPPQHPPAHRRKKLRLAMPPSPPDTVRGEQEEERVREERGGRGQWINDREEEERGVAEDAMEEEEAGQEVESEYSGRSEEAHVSEEVESEQVSAQEEACDVTAESSESQSTDSDVIVISPPRPTQQGSERMRVEILSLTFDPQSPVALDEGVQRVYVEYRLLGVPMEMTETPISLRTPREGEEGSERMRVEILSLTFDPQSPVALDEGVQRVYVEYRLLGVPMEMTETPISLRTPREGEEVHYNFTRVIYVDRTVNSALRQYLYTMLEGTDPNQGR